MKLSLTVLIVALVAALLVGGLITYASLSPSISKKNTEIGSLKDQRKKLQADLEEIKELVETDAAKINGNMQDMFKHAGEAEETLKKDSLKGVAHNGEELAEHAQNTLELTPPKGKEMIDTYKEMAEGLKTDSKALEKAAKEGSLAKAKEAFTKIHASCNACHALFRQTDEDIHPTEEHEAH